MTEYGPWTGKEQISLAKSFNNNWKKIEDLGFDETFKLMWNYYLSYCEGGFLSNNIDLKQIKLNIN